MLSRELRQPKSLPPDEANTGTLLLEAYRAFERELFRAFRNAGHDALRPKHGAVLANLGRDGARLTELAALAGISKPSMKELVDELSDLGYLDRRDDPTDRRARLIVLTEEGLAVASLARRAIDRIEKGYAKKLGKRSYDALRSALATLLK
ncbi:MAG: MarR family winged helix-turn-helix transcriptional regulator [Thermoanaerobaculia bacterium]